MHKTNLAIVAVIAAFTINASAQTPAPFTDALALGGTATTSVVFTGTSTPSALQIANAQVGFHSRVKGQLKNGYLVALRNYLASLALFASDDPAKVSTPLTAAQKSAALTSAETVEVVTIAWEYYNILAPVTPGLPTPPVPAPTVSGS